MDNKTYLGTLSEIKVMCRLVEEGYDVFNQIAGKSPIDMIALKNGELKRVSVKSTQSKNSNSNNWCVQLKTVRSNKTKNTITNFDNTSCEILAIYIEPEDRVILYNAKDILTKTILIIKPIMAEQADWRLHLP